jgi:hypothetical protein
MLVRITPVVEDAMDEFRCDDLARVLACADS